MKEQLVIKGGTPLIGEVLLSGAKNAVLPILSASILSPDGICLQNVPNLDDVQTMLELLASMGVNIKADWSSSSVKLDARASLTCFADKALVSKMRASFLVLGPLLARFGRARVALPGGCAIGARPVNLHVDALRQLGADIVVKEGFVEASVKDRLSGADITFPTVTVTGTENILMAAVLAKGETILRNAACEPEVTDLALCLIKMGASIEGIGTNTLRIQGVSSLSSVDYTVISDRIEAGTFLLGALVTSGQVRVHPINPSLLNALIEIMEEAGAEVSVGVDWIEADMRGRRPHAVSVGTAPYPLFPTDLQAQLMVMNVIAVGSGVIHEAIFENRFMHVNELRKMGARIVVEGSVAHTEGVEQLTGACVVATDLRASASLVLAACQAKGVSTINSVEYIDRGYEAIELKLAKLGVNIKRQHAVAQPVEAALLA